MSNEQSRRNHSSPAAALASVPNPPPLPPTHGKQPPPLQRAKDVANRFFGYSTRPQTAHDGFDYDRSIRSSLISARHASLGIGQNATASHKTGLEINTIALNEQGTHALLGGREIFKTIRVEDGTCTEDLNLRSAIRSTSTTASGKPRQVYSIDIADVAWARGDCGDLVAAATSSGKIILYDLGRAGLQAAQLHEHYRQVHKVTFNPHRGSLLLSGSQDGSVRLWDVRDAKNQASALQSKRKFSGQTDGVRDVKWSPTEGTDFAFGTDSGWIQCWDIRNLKAAKVRIPAHSQTCNAVDWHPDGKHLLSASADRTVRIWDFSSSRKSKASWEIKAPYSVMNARWRPSYESSMPLDNGARLCTQVVTSYDRDNPSLHLWDLRRPALPFRAMSPYPSAPTDLSWHSQDLLWTVGREGIFLQSDIQHAPKAIEKRNLQAFGISPSGDVNFVVQKRRLPRRHLQVHDLTAQTIGNLPKQSKSLSGSPESGLLSRSWTDDTIDHSFLSVLPITNHTRANSSNAKLPNKTTATLKLDEILMNRKSFRPQQSAVRGLIPDHMDPTLLKFLAKNYMLRTPEAFTHAEFLKAVKSTFNKNSEVAQAAGLYRMAHSWRIVGVVASELCMSRIAYQEEHSKSKQVSKELRAPTLGDMALKILRQHKSATQSPASIRPISSIAQQLAAPESTSNVPTPLARPVQSSLHLADFPDFDSENDRLTLPPSVTNHHSEKVATKPSAGQRLTSSNLIDWEMRNAGTDRLESVKKWSAKPKTPLSLEPVNAKVMNVPPKLQKFYSDDSFTFLASTDSGGASLSASFGSSHFGPTGMVNERPSRPPRTVAERPPALEDPQVPVNDSVRPRLAGDAPTSIPADAKAPSVVPNESFKPFSGAPDGSDFDTEEGKPYVLSEMLAELVNYHSGKYGDAQAAAQFLTIVTPLLPPTHPLPDSEVKTTVSWYADAYTTMGHTPEEVAAIIDNHLALVIKAGLQPLQMESIFSAYHDQLQSHQLFVEAAELRKLCYPAFPTIYDDYTKDIDIYLKCGDCGTALQLGSMQLRSRSARVQSCLHVCYVAIPHMRTVRAIGS
ncbi:Hypothetical protein R9X50_00450500 [Acrodontium crateriforme]|uniref:WD repeat protein n=1 Tax=Acrodontium crateriforme TaxID=150365 RepID=A0AAQ3M6B5_9PEZI|nr:Hypothetical protein R9X50_00450500 [Acrodontium crateriforme]